MTREQFLQEVEYELIAEQDEIPVRGNALASGDETLDRQVEDDILARLDNGDIWAWASVKVTATWRGFEGHDYLGGCSYEDEDDFVKRSGFYEDMKGEALRDLEAAIHAASEAIQAYQPAR